MTKPKKLTENQPKRPVGRPNLSGNPSKPKRGRPPLTDEQKKERAIANAERARIAYLVRTIKEPAISKTKIKLPLSELFGPNREKAVAVIVKLATKSRDELMRLTAAKYILDRTDGPIPKPIEIGGKDGSPLIHVTEDNRPSLAEIFGVGVRESLASTGTEGEFRDNSRTIDGRISDDDADNQDNQTQRTDD